MHAVVLAPDQELGKDEGVRARVHAGGPPLEGCQCGRVDNEFVCLFVKSGHRFKAPQVGAMSKLGLAITAHEQARPAILKALLAAPKVIEFCNA